MPASTVAELSRVNEWLMMVLAGDPALSSLVGDRVYVDQAPQEAETPMVVAAFLGGADKVLTTSARLTHTLYLVRAIAEGSSYDLVSQIADRIEAVMWVPQQGTVLGSVRITSVFREQPHQRRDAENGIPFVYMGGFYRVRVQPSFQ
jgi:hypothetical protein